MKRWKALLGAIVILVGQSCISVANAMDQETIIRRLEAIERKNNDLEKENIELKRRLSRVESNNPSARNNKSSQDGFREVNNPRNENNAKSSKSRDNAKTQLSSLDESEFISSQYDVSRSVNKSNIDIYNDRHFELRAIILLREIIRVLKTVLERPVILVMRIIQNHRNPKITSKHNSHL